MLAGRWTVSTNKGTINLIFNLQTHGNTISGSVSHGSTTAKIRNGKIMDKSFSFESTLKIKRMNINAYVNGYFVDDTHIRGMAKCKFGSIRYTAVKS